MTPNEEIGWDGPLDVEWDYQLDVLRREVRDAAPVGKTGALKRAFDNPRSVTINKKKTEITIGVFPPDPAANYAAAINFGSGIHGPKGAKYRIPHEKNTTAKVLRFFWAKLGGVVFFKHIMHPGVKGQHFVEFGVLSWWKKLTGKKYTVVKWAEGRAGTTFPGRRGIVSAPDL